jgi:molybdopterin molybdotransferase
VEVTSIGAAATVDRFVSVRFHLAVGCAQAGGVPSNLTKSPLFLRKCSSSCLSRFTFHSPVLKAEMNAGAGDVRMKGFARRTTVDAALAWIDAHVRALDAETVPLRAAAGRVLAFSLSSQVDVPGFDRATMDGYAVDAISVEGASSYNRIPLTVIGDALPGQPFAGAVPVGEAIRIMTGAPIPTGCNAVVPAEWIEQGAAGDARVFAIGSVSPGKHVGTHGEDIPRGAVLLGAGRTLRPQDLGVLSSVGIAEVAIVRKPRVRLAITGNELLPAGSTPAGACIADANGPMLAALVDRDGGHAAFPTPVRDDASAIIEALHADADVVIVSGGSSVGIEDLAPTLLAAHGELAVHGIAMRPSSPTGFGRIGSRLVFLLPGNPVSCLCAYDFFAGRAIRMLGGRAAIWPYRSIRGTLRRKITSQIGRLDYARVQLAGGAIEPLAVTGASILSSTTRGDGFVIVPDDSEGFPVGAEVDVWLYA